MTPPRCDMGKLALALIAIVTNSSYTSIPPILPLEIDRQHINEEYVSIVFLAFTIGSLIAPPLVSRHFESRGTANVIAYSLAGMSVGFWCLGQVFRISHDEKGGGGGVVSQYADNDVGDEGGGEGEGMGMGDIGGDHPPPPENQLTIVALLTIIQFFLGAFYAVITTGYYSLATLIFTEKESAMSSVEAAVGLGYIVGPIFGSMLYEGMGYKYTYTTISLCIMGMAILTWKCLARHLRDGSPPHHHQPLPSHDDEDDVDGGSELDGEKYAEEHGLEMSDMEGTMSKRQSTNNGHSCEDRDVATTTQQPSAISLLAYPKILLGALTLCWVDVTWSFMEPLLSKQLDHNFDVSMGEIGMIFSISSIVYVPMVYLVQYLPSQGRGRHRTIAISVMLTPLAVLLVGSDSLAVLIVGVTLNGILPTPVWVHLLPWMQEEALKLFPDPNTSRCVNDLTATIYNSFLTLGQVVGYVTGPLLASRGFARTTQMVALLTFIQSLLFFFGAGGFLSEERPVVPFSVKVSVEDGEDEIGFLPEEKEMQSVRRIPSRGSSSPSHAVEVKSDKPTPPKIR